MTTTVNLKPILHRKVWETLVSAPAASAAGGFLTPDKFGTSGHIFNVQGASSIYLYEADTDAWAQLPNSGIAGTFGAGAAGCARSLGAMGGAFQQDATAGTTTTLTTNKTIVRGMAGKRLRVVSGTGVGYDGTVASNTLGANAVITVTPASGVAFDATTKFQVFSGSLWFFCPGAGTVGFRVYDIATNTWTAKSVTGVATTFGTGAQLISTAGCAKEFATGTATSGSATTLVNSGKSWGTNMWANYQVRIKSGTGAGQIRVISSNNGTTLTVPTWTTNPDATSVYAIEGDDNAFYLLGNNAVTMYKYSVSGDSWSTLSPTAARAGAMAGGGTAGWIENVTSGWDNETQVAHYSTTLYRQNGRYIYSMRGGGVSTLDVYDIAANTWVSAISYGYQNETFNTGTSGTDADGMIYIAKEATGRVFKFDVAKNLLEPFSTNQMQVALAGTAVEGDKLAFARYIDGATTITYLYIVRHSGSDFNRVLVF